jgi:hypothetical protein
MGQCVLTPVVVHQQAAGIAGNSFAISFPVLSKNLASPVDLPSQLASLESNVKMARKPLKPVSRTKAFSVKIREGW